MGGPGQACEDDLDLKKLTATHWGGTSSAAPQESCTSSRSGQNIGTRCTADNYFGAYLPLLQVSGYCFCEDIKIVDSLQLINPLPTRDARMGQSKVFDVQTAASVPHLPTIGATRSAHYGNYTGVLKDEIKFNSVIRNVSLTWSFKFSRSSIESRGYTINSR
ncbi:hypothetical protein RRG08_041934 [Elysia crispata]|uniref:Uncharacterized protein n=1 Tax=Elysia crispata TaxID=231223 RepID=A0AAE0XXE5_9GAST|nr:hypothetical protein RRG08_041934 [Elysia crispata]